MEVTFNLCLVEDLFVFSLAFDLWYVVAAFFMFLCLLSEVISYLGLLILQQAAHGS